MKKYALEITGTMPLLMHADTLADPLHPLTKKMKAVSGKRVKTDDDHEAMAAMEFHASLYLDDDGQIVVPGPNILKSLIEGGRITKSGAKIERGVVIAGTDFPLVYDGPRDLDALYADKRYVDRRSVKVGQTKVMRVRPIFRKWALRAEAYADPAILSQDTLQAIANDAGQLVGLGDHRKVGGYGRYDIVVDAL